MEYRGIIVEEALDDNRLINRINKINKVVVSGHNKPEERWHLYDVEIDESEMFNLGKHVVSGWYIHFWHDNKVTVFYHDRSFQFDYDKKETWNEALSYGKHIGIPECELDFPIKGL